MNKWTLNNLGKTLTILETHVYQEAKKKFQKVLCLADVIEYTT